MNRDPYVDSILGKWTFDKKASSKGSKYCWKRSGTFTLHKDHAQDYTNPETFKKQKVHGEVVLTETKLIDKESSDIGLFRGLELTPKSVVVDMIP